MADRINFTQQINDSAQVGDTLYFTNVDAANNAQANVSTLVGYFAEVNLVQNATDRRELFGIGSEIFVSSK